MYYKRFTSIPGLLLLDASSISPSSVVMAKKKNLQTFPTTPERGRGV